MNTKPFKSTDMLHYILNKAENWHTFAKEQRERTKLAHELNWLTLQASRLHIAEAPIAHVLNRLQWVLYERVHVRQQLLLGLLLVTLPLQRRHHRAQRLAWTRGRHVAPNGGCGRAEEDVASSVLDTGPGARSRGFSATRLLFILTIPSPLLLNTMIPT